MTEMPLRFYMSAIPLSPPAPEASRGGQVRATRIFCWAAHALNGGGGGY
eukprot:COSAG01_NODE_8668_length_2703_cov_4.591398_3_plen_49_part_00